MERPNLSRLIEEAKATYAAMSLAEKEELHQKQRESWVRAEMLMGNDADEARTRKFFTDFIDPCDVR